MVEWYSTVCRILYIYIYIYSHQGNTSQNLSEILYLSGWLSPKRTNVSKVVEKRELGLVHCSWECKIVQPVSLWKTVWRFLIELKLELPYDPAVPFLGIYPKYLKRNQNTNLKRYMHPNVYRNIIYSCQGLETIKVFINRWMDKKDMAYIHFNLNFSFWWLFMNVCWTELQVLQSPGK